MKLDRCITSVIAADDPFVTQLSLVVRRSCRVSSLQDLVRVMRAKLRGSTTVDLIGHSATPDRLLVVGGDIIDTRRPSIVDAFLAIAPVLRRHRVSALRLLGCGTATRQAGRRTLVDLARILEPVSVFGTVDQLGPRSFDRFGLVPAAHRLLISATDAH